MKRAFKLGGWGYLHGAWWCAGNEARKPIIHFSAPRRVQRTGRGRGSPVVPGAALAFAEPCSGSFACSLCGRRGSGEWLRLYCLCVEQQMGVLVVCCGGGARLCGALRPPHPSTAYMYHHVDEDAHRSSGAPCTSLQCQVRSPQKKACGLPAQRNHHSHQSTRALHLEQYLPESRNTTPPLFSRQDCTISVASPFSPAWRPGLLHSPLRGLLQFAPDRSYARDSFRQHNA